MPWAACSTILCALPRSACGLRCRPLLLDPLLPCWSPSPSQQRAGGGLARASESLFPLSPQARRGQAGNFCLAPSRPGKHSQISTLSSNSCDHTVRPPATQQNALSGKLGFRSLHVLPRALEIPSQSGISGQASPPRSTPPKRGLSCPVLSAQRASSAQGDSAQHAFAPALVGSR